MDDRLVRLAEPGGSGRQSGRAALIFAIVGVVVALAAGGAYLFKQEAGPPARSPEDTVREFLAAVFLASSPDRLAPVVCASWDPADAVIRTAKEVDERARVSWDEFRVVSADEGRMTLRARLGLRLPDDLRPSSYHQWRFNLVDEAGWRVCEARPFVV